MARRTKAQPPAPEPGAPRKKRWDVGASVTARTYIGEIEADTMEEAIEKGERLGCVSVCHQCSRAISDPEIDQVWAEEIVDEG